MKHHQLIVLCVIGWALAVWCWFDARRAYTATIRAQLEQSRAMEAVARSFEAMDRRMSGWEAVAAPQPLPDGALPSLHGMGAQPWPSTLRWTEPHERR